MNELPSIVPNIRYNLANVFLAKLGGYASKQLDAKRVRINLKLNNYVDSRDRIIFPAYCHEMNGIPFVFGTRLTHPIGKDREYPYFFLKFLPWKKIVGEEELKRTAGEREADKLFVIHTRLLKERYRNYWMGSIGVINANVHGSLVVTRDSIYNESINTSALTNFPNMTEEGVLTPSRYVDVNTGKILLDIGDIGRYFNFLKDLFEEATLKRKKAKEEKKLEERVEN